MFKIILTIIIAFANVFCLAQNADSIRTHTLQTVTVTAYKEKPVRETSLDLIPLKIDSLNKFGNYNLTDLLAKTPGISMLSTGPAIAKPVIRGLYGNRVLVLISGLKFDNQQWQEEHGLGISDFGLDRVELIKGPMSVLYGTEAIGGIINLVEEDKPAMNSRESDISLRFNSNTLGGMIQGGYKANYGNHWWRIRIGAENNADYSDGNNKRVLNSRFDGYDLKASYGFQHKKWISENNLLSSFNRFGFIFNDIYTFITPDARYGRSLAVNPCHLVLLNIVSSENKILLSDNSKLNVNIGLQSNERMENEGGGAISLNMHLLTIQYLIKWEKKLSPANRLILSHLDSFEDNTNFGARKIVPDANMEESNVSVYLETTIKNKVILENGIGIGEKYIKTFFTASVNGPDKEIHPFHKLSGYYNLFSGITWFPNDAFNLKCNIATGVRIANLAELSSNGLHEGVFTYEIGNPNMKNEQNIACNLYANYDQKFIEFSASPFFNFFYNYIYLAPVNEDWFGFPVYRYKQQNATQYGGECSLNVKPFKQFQLGASYAGMVSKTQDGNYTPYVPAQKITPAVSYSFAAKKTIECSVFSNADFYLAQNNTAPYEKVTPSYGLLNLGASATFSGKRNTYQISVTVNNLLNAAYYDHLSRFKNYGLLNMGRNIALNCKVKFNGQIR